MTVCNVAWLEHQARATLFARRWRLVFAHFQPEALPKQAEHSTLAQSIWREVAEWDTRERGNAK